MDRLLSLVSGRRGAKGAARSENPVRQTETQAPDAEASDTPLVDEDIQIPDWFLGNYVKTSSELQAAPAPLIICNNKIASRQDNHHDASINDRYEMDAVFFDAICRLIRQDEVLDQGEQAQGDGSGHGAFFSYDVMQLRFPTPKGDMADNLGSGFLQCTVEHLARTLDAHLTTLTLDNIAELVRDLRGAKEQALARDPKVMLKEWFKEQAHFSPAAQMLSAVFSSPYVRHSAVEDGGEDHQLNSTPLVVHMPNIFDVAETVHQAEIELFACFEMAVALFQSAGAAVAQSRNILVIATDRFPSSDTEDGVPYEKFASKLGSRPLEEPVCIIPTNSAAQQVLLERDGRKRQMAKNVHALRSAMRMGCPGAAENALLSPGTDWTFLDGTRAAEVLEKSQISEQDMKSWIKEMKGQLDAANLQKTIAGVGRRQELLLAWASERLDQSNSRWSGFSAQIQQAIASVQEKSADGELYAYEAKLLESIIDPKEVKSAWDDIVVDVDVEEDFKRIIKSHTATIRSARVSKRRRTGGGLVYGPPGTGKTYLAGVLARESGLVTISVSAAELESRWVGESEKAIAALFNLGRLLGPAIIFIDEADALFRSRSMSSHTWERTQVNQFLLEMSGLGNSKTAPFVLLCTNLPYELDHAVLRRVPSFFYLGLPSAAQRRRILQIQLKGWTLDENLDLDRVASLTTRFSGSDLQHLYDKATFNCEGSADVENPDGEPVLRQIHLEEALEKTSPKWSRDLHTFIKHWAEEFDRPGYKKLMSYQGAEDERRLAENRPPASITLSQADFTVQGAHPGDCACDNSDSGFDGTPVDVSQAEAFPVEAHGQLLAPDSQETRSRPDEFKYHSLDIRPQSNQTRLLSISAGDKAQHGQQMISCTMETVDLDAWTDEYKQVRVEAGDTWVELHDKVSEELLRDIPGEVDGIVLSPDSMALRTWRNRATDDDSALQQTGELAAISCPDRYEWGDFMALSHVWGKQERDETILLNGFPFAVTPNLHRALCVLRDSFEVSQRKLRVWIDALCINQKDVEEREHQVRRMQAIFANALCVRGWVGEPSSSPLASKLPAVKELLATSKVDRDEPWAYDGRLARLPVARLEESIDRAVVDVIEEFLSAEFWQRIWIVQEIVLASSLSFWYGAHTFTPLEVIRMVDMAGTHSREPPSWSLPGNAWRQRRSKPGRDHALALTVAKIISARPDFMMVHLDEEDIGEVANLAGAWRASGHQLHSAVTLARMSKATDDRDKVFGLLALLPTEIALRTRPAYGPHITREQVWMQFSRTCFEVRGNLHDMLRSSTGPAGRDSGPDIQQLPSWAFDLTYRATANTVWLGFSFYSIKFDADNGLEAAIEFSDDGRTLICRGLVVDTVPSLAGLPPGPQSSNSQPKPEPPTRDELRLSLSRVLLHDIDYDFSQGPSPLDLPYFAPEDIQIEFLDDVLETTPDARQVEGNSSPRPWVSVLHDGDARTRAAVCDFFADLVHPYRDFDVGRGVPLRDLFASRGATYESVETYLDMFLNMDLRFGLRRLFVTGEGRLGSVPTGAEAGDVIAVLAGCDMPVVLRPRGDGYVFVGPCFVDGLMKGEAVSGVVNPGTELTKVEIY